MYELSENMSKLDTGATINKIIIVSEVLDYIKHASYEAVEVNDQKPWGAYIRIDSKQADRFVEEFFPGLTPAEARLGNSTAELSPKFLIVAPNQRLSWQYHNRRAERWTFLSAGSYEKSVTDEETEPMMATIGDVVQFAKGERHRLVGVSDNYTVVAEIWQHSDPQELSNEDDIVRLADDYER
jgi:mannose-6-phosphate isomerase